MNLPVASWRLPDLTYPFPPQIHPHVEAGEAHLLAWVEGEGLVTTQRELGAFTRTRFGELVAREFPAATAEGLLVACEIYAWHFVFDDRFCDEPEEGSDTAQLALTVLRVLAEAEESLASGRGVGPVHGKDPCARALAGICGRLGDLGGSVAVERFLAAERMYFLGVLAQMAAVQTQTKPVLDGYITMRYYNCGTPVALAVLDTTYGFALGESDYRHPQVQRLCRITAHITGWANDVFSYGRESTDAKAISLNLPVVLAHAYALKPQQAVDEAARMHNAEMATYLTLEAQVDAWASPELHRYLAGLRSMMRGFYDWGLNTHRYRVNDHFDNVPAPPEDSA
ncbi:hypothetical protein FHS40_009079 [Streptomyces spectabilis]|uniref:Terpene synthase n=1 Tax=Streptomyces spectabilis TaxID=68270 RepID=A0A7W8F087_STRST|nr:hypothetical protein [Streptomyces spectabilis]MBB5109949.1 hypothetical protein [Streptomyces spectabilis]